MAHTEAFLGTPQQWLRAERARRPGVIPTHGVGANLLRIIREQPGIHFRALGRQAGLTSSGQLRHHLDRLADLGAIAEVKDGRFSRFFAGGDEDPRFRQRQARFSRPVPNLIARLLADRPMSRTELRRRLGCADSTLGYHLNRLLQVGDIQRRIGPNGHEYALTDSGLVPPELPWRATPPGAPAGEGPAATPSPLAQPGQPVAVAAAVAPVAAPVAAGLQQQQPQPQPQPVAAAPGLGLASRAAPAPGLHLPASASGLPGGVPVSP